ncbi:MAG: septum formation initiator family protein [Hyphomonas sp.]|nr:septum formation initiator family protein [Hyphomonas sp.]
MSRRAFLFGLVVVALLIVSLYRAKYGAKDTAAELLAVEAQIEDARQEKVMLETELSHMSRREWIEEYARSELGMAPPKPEQMASEGDLDALVGEPNSLTVPAPVPTQDGEAPE